MPSSARSRQTSTAAAGLLAQFEVAGTRIVLPIERLLDDLPSVVFFVKDPAGRYLAANKELAVRCGFADKAEVVGKRPSELFPRELAARYERQDQRVLQTGRPVLDQLELHLCHDRSRGWCLTNKYPVRDPASGEVVALMGLSRDVEASAHGAAARGFPELVLAIESLQNRIEDPPGIQELAALSHLSQAQFSRLVRHVFHLTPQQLAMKVRIDEALHLLTTTHQSLAEIALSTGFCDQSAFTRHFSRMTGLPPGAFRTQSASSA